MTRRVGMVLGLLGWLPLLGCNELAGNQPLPAGTAAPSSYNTPAGALSMRNQAIVTLEQALNFYFADTGLLTDELESDEVGASPGVLSSTPLPLGGSLDERILPELSSGPGGTDANYDYGNLQTVRGYSNQALGALAAYDTGAPPALRGELYALEGYAEILLADFFCSGVPLSTLDFNKDFTYHPSSTTAQVYQDAIAKEDSALALSTDSARILNLAMVLQGRAQLALGKYAAAADDVTTVPDGFQYQLAVNCTGGCFQLSGTTPDATVSNREGSNGMPFISSGDPRSADTVLQAAGTSSTIFTTIYFPDKYSAAFTTGFAPVTVADWVEARLIRAEAALAAGDPTTWLNQLNTLRATAPIPGTTQPQPTLLPQLSDPGTDTARVSLLFQERAYWLFLTGHRQGDLRRLIRNYGRLPNQTYPNGVYLAPGAGRYGTDVNAPIPDTENPNPYFHGCLDRDA